MNPWILAARPKTLPAAIVPVWTGTVLAILSVPDIAWGLFFSTLLSCLCIQVATNLFNDAIDSQKGADTAARLGPVRATAAGLLPIRAVWTGALVFCVLAALLAGPILQARGWPLLAIGTVSLILAWAYTGGPFPLAYVGLGELFVILFFGFIAVGGSWFVQTGSFPDRTALLVGLQTGLLSSVLLAINNLRDVAEDATTGKRTLAVRFGQSFARLEIAVFCLLPGLLSLVQAWVTGEGEWALPALTLPLGVWLTRAVSLNPPGPKYNAYLALGALQMLLFAGLFTLAVFRLR